MAIRSETAGARCLPATSPRTRTLPQHAIRVPQVRCAQPPTPVVEVLPNGVRSRRSSASTRDRRIRVLLQVRCVQPPTPVVKILPNGVRSRPSSASTRGRRRLQPKPRRQRQRNSRRRRPPVLCPPPANTSRSCSSHRWNRWSHAMDAAHLALRSSS
jgi:hypothetical protein